MCFGLHTVNWKLIQFWVLLNRAPTSTQLHPPPPSSLQHPQQYLNQNIARNWAIFPNLDQISNPKIHFWANLGPKIQSCPFCLKIGTHGISRMLILIPTLVFWISNTNFFSGQIGAKKVKVVCVNWKKAQMISWGCWFLFQHYFYECPSLNSFLGKSGPKKILSVFPENWHAWHLHDANFYSNISFLNVRP